MNGFRRALIIISIVFATGAFICSFFILKSYQYYSYYQNGRYHYGYYETSNPYGYPVVSLLSLVTTLQIPLLVFSHFDKKGFYRAAIPLTVICFVSSILSVVFSGISIAYCTDEAAAIVSTVFCGILIALFFLIFIFGLILLGRAARMSHYNTPNTYRHSRPQSEIEEIRRTEEAPIVAKQTEVIQKSSSDFEKEKIELLREYKKLLDDQIITQEEFDKKKKDILG